MYNFSKATDTEKYFTDILEELGDSKITDVFCAVFTWFNRGYSVYMQDEPIFIRFDNGKCLVIEYYDINRLQMEYREMTKAELQIYAQSDTKDLFNRTAKILDASGKVTFIEEYYLSYASIKNIKLKRVTKPYSAWIDGSIADGIVPTDETFGELNFIMENGKSFSVCFDDAESDGYSLIWSEDAECRQSSCEK